MISFHCGIRSFFKILDCIYFNGITFAYFWFKLETLGFIVCTLNTTIESQCCKFLNVSLIIVALVINWPLKINVSSRQKVVLSNVVISRFLDTTKTSNKIESHDNGLVILIVFYQPLYCQIFHGFVLNYHLKYNY